MSVCALRFVFWDVMGKVGEVVMVSVMVGLIFLVVKREMMVRMRVGWLLADVL